MNRKAAGREAHRRPGAATTQSVKGKMSTSTRVMRRPQRARPPTARAAAAVIATAVLALLVAACGGSKGGHVAQIGSTATQSTSNPPAASSNALAFSRCIRSRGVPNFPDPIGSGGIPKETPRQLGVSDARYRAAQSACAHLLPNSGGAHGLSPDQVQQLANGMRSFARCMRSHGVPSWPDPSTDSEGAAVFYLQGKIAIDAPQIIAKVRACSHLIPPSTRENGPPGGVPMCPGDRPDPSTQHSECE
jgi:hypothetical protein